MPLMLTPAAISQPGPQVSTTTSTSDQNANDVRSFGDAYQHSLANGAVKAPVAKATASPLDKTSVRTALRHQADTIDDLPDGLRLHFAHRVGLLAELVHIIEQERLCCQFLRFQITVEPSGGSLIFEVTGPEGTRELLRAL